MNRKKIKSIIEYIMEIIFKFLSIITVLFILWLFISWIEVFIFKSNPEHIYWSLNFWKLFYNLLLKKG